MNVIMNVCTYKDKINKKSDNCRQTFQYFWCFLFLFCFPSSSLNIGNYKENAYPLSPSQEFLANLFLFYLLCIYVYLLLHSKSRSLSLASLLFCILISGYHVILNSYPWLPWLYVLLSLATLSFCILISGYHVICILIPGYPFILYPCLCLYHVTLYYYPWLPCHSVFLTLASLNAVFLSLATMPFCIIIPGFPVILYS
jgi:hypothetical protein